jgi:hypothetical protein
MANPTSTSEAKKEELQWELLGLTLTALGFFFAYKRYQAKKKQIGS